jgi:hypothetical protein
MTSEGFEGGFGGIYAGEDGKSEAGSTRLSDGLEGMVLSDQDGRGALFCFSDSKMVCCGEISSDQGIRRLYTSPCLKGETRCVVLAHFTPLDPEWKCFAELFSEWRYELLSERDAG